jgi:hypothetical protein
MSEQLQCLSARRRITFKRGGHDSVARDATALRLVVCDGVNPGLKQPWALGRHRVAVKTWYGSNEPKREPETQNLKLKTRNHELLFQS